MELISMTCRTCGGKLQISQEAEQFICRNCGSEFSVSFHDGAISIRRIVEGIQRIQTSSYKTASELALRRIEEEKKVLHSEYHIQAILLNLSRRVDDKYHFKLDDDLLERVGLYQFSSTADEEALLRLSEFCEQAIRFEQRRAFRDRYWINVFTEAIESIREVIPKLRELRQQEEEHRKVIAS